MVATGLKWYPFSRPATRAGTFVAYIINPFLLKPGQPIPTSHTNYWESWQMAQTFLELGYAVDVIHYSNVRFEPEKHYDVLVDARFNMERLGPRFAESCIKIFHIDSGHYVFHAAAQYERLLDLQRRRGITLPPRKMVPPNAGIEHADCATMLGNDFTYSTYCYARKQIYRLPLPAAITFDFPDDKDFEQCRRHFLWFGSEGMVHKGLDLLLEAFAAMPELELTSAARFMASLHSKRHTGKSCTRLRIFIPWDG